MRARALALCALAFLPCRVDARVNATSSIDVFLISSCTECVKDRNSIFCTSAGSDSNWVSNGTVKMTIAGKKALLGPGPGASYCWQGARFVVVVAPRRRAAAPPRRRRITRAHAAPRDTTPHAQARLAACSKTRAGRTTFSAPRTRRRACSAATSSSFTGNASVRARRAARRAHAHAPLRTFSRHATPRPQSTRRRR